MLGEIGPTQGILSGWTGDAVRCLVIQSCPALLAALWAVAHQAPLSLGILQARILQGVAMPSSTESSWPRDQTQGSWVACEFVSAWATREAQEYRVGSLSLLQRMFPTQESNCSLLHCRQSLYLLGYQRSPKLGIIYDNKPSKRHGGVYFKIQATGSDSVGQILTL